MRVEIKKRGLWAISLLGGAMAWTFHLMTTYAIGEFACVGDTPNLAAWLLVGVSVLAIAFTVFALWVSWKGRHREGERFIHRAGLLANAAFLLFIVSQTLPIFILLEGC